MCQNMFNPLGPDDAKTQPLFRALLWQNGDRYELTLFRSSLNLWLQFMAAIYGCYLGASHHCVRGCTVAHSNNVTKKVPLPISKYTKMSFSNPNPAMPFCKAKRHPGECLRHSPG
eukprot:sb/3476814/